MTTITDTQLLSHAERAKGKVVILTGGANGIGKETALLFASYGAKIVIGDTAVDAAHDVVREIVKLGGEAVSIQCNVLDWDEQVALFELAISCFGVVDVVIPAAGVTERGDVCAGFLNFKNGKPVAPRLDTLEINLIGVFNTVHLALYYFKHNRPSTSDPTAWKALVLVGSMAAWEAIPLAPMYSSSKHAILGLMRSIYPLLARDNVRIACVDSWWADTKLLPVAAKVVLAGIPLTPVPRIALTLLCCATDPDAATSGCPWILPDGGPVLRLGQEHVTAGAYETINARIAKLKIAQGDLRAGLAVVIDLWRISRRVIILSSITIAAVAMIVGAYQRI